MKDKIVSELVVEVKQLLGASYDVFVKKQLKNNGVILTALNIVKSGKTGYPMIYINESLDMIENGTVDMHTAAEKLVDVYMKHADVEDIETFVTDFDRSRILENVVCQLINTKKNKERLVDTVHTDFLDLSVVYCVIVPTNDDCSLLVKRNLCEGYDIRFEELDFAAMRNTKLRSFTIDTMPSILGDIGVSSHVLDSAGAGIYVLSNPRRVNGASVMLYPEEFKKVSGFFGDDLYILPSSIHEVIAIPVSVGKIADLEDMVRTVNSTKVSEEEFLSDSVYRYNRAENKITIAV